MNTKTAERLEGGIYLFFQRIAIIAGATIAMGTIVSFVSSLMWERSVRPVMSAVISEARAREQGDSLLTVQITRMSRDRIDIIDILSFPVGAARDRRIEMIRARWDSEGN